MARKKPKKPYQDFPLFPHANGQWAKKIRGRLHYFGTWDDSNAALTQYLEVRDDLQAGRTPRSYSDALTVRDLGDAFLVAKRLLVDSGELSIRTWQDYYATAKLMVDHLGGDTPVEALTPVDFETLRANIARGRSAVNLGNNIQRIRSIFKYGYDADLLGAPVKFGPLFKKPGKKKIREEKHAAGLRMFDAEEIRKAINAARVPLKAMILLGINCGFGQTDVANIPFSAIHEGWVDFPRPKTAVKRRCPLWPETKMELEAAIANRPAPKSEDDAHLVFLTKYGMRWVKIGQKEKPDDSVGKEFTKLLKNLGIKRKGVSFYALRHTFETIGQESKDPLAVQWIMGHASQDMGSHYRETVSDARLQAVTNIVREWLFPAELRR